jgi:hypothetical protein
VRHKKICSICGGRYVSVGHDAMPINDGLCCDHCERFVVVPARVRSIMQREEVLSRRETKSKHLAGSTTDI